jgi:hypothetical protein
VMGWNVTHLCGVSYFDYSAVRCSVPLRLSVLASCLGRLLCFCFKLSFTMRHRQSLISPIARTALLYMPSEYPYWKSLRTVMRISGCGSTALRQRVVGEVFLFLNDETGQSEESFLFTVRAKR